MSDFHSVSSRTFTTLAGDYASLQNSYIRPNFRCGRCLRERALGDPRPEFRCRTDASDNGACKTVDGNLQSDGIGQWRARSKCASERQRQRGADAIGEQSKPFPRSFECICFDGSQLGNSWLGDSRRWLRLRGSTGAGARRLSFDAGQRQWTGKFGRRHALRALGIGQLSRECVSRHRYAAH